MRPIFAISIIALLAGCSTPATKTLKPAGDVPTVRLNQSAVTREIAAERAQMAKTHVEGALVR